MYFKRFVLFALILVSMEQVRSWLHSNTPHALSKTEQNIVIFVHGTVNAPRTMGQLIHALRGHMRPSAYAKKVETMRNDPFFYQSQPIGPVGLQRIDNNRFQYGDASGLFAHIYGIVNEQAGNERPTQYYTFGWTGQLNRPARMQAARELLAALTKEIEFYKESGINPHIHLIGYSHGGNVCINLSQITPKDTDIRIDELVLLGTPIQKCAHDLIKHPIFNKVYNLYSEKDTVQTIDWFSMDTPPGRRFIKRKGDSLSKKLNQIRIRMIEKRPAKNGIKRIVTEPNHSNLWFFSWGRKEDHNPLNPVPVAAFVPMILNTAQKSKLANMAIDIVVDGGTLSFQQVNPETLIEALMPNHLISKFMGMIGDCVPNNYYQEYQAKYRSRKP